jgi:membrane protease YdiL (CAAX protease family)
MLLLLAPDQMRDTSPTGAAWVMGRRDAIISGFLLGLLLAGALFFMSLFVHPQYPSHVGPLTQMSMTRGWPQVLWGIVAVFLAPPTEEMLFRGAAYGGFRKSCGAFWAGVLVTVIFVGLHFAEFMYYPAAMFSITCLALVTLWCRLRWGAIGPAIAVHVAYNLIVTIATFYSTSNLSSTLR